MAVRKTGAAAAGWIAEQPGSIPLLGADPHWQARYSAEVDALRVDHRETRRLD
ncbi:hypothetical protein P3H15_52185 [Rhodococcus sp. T2V]|uniref:hypothetical protein n=1 Tax=Rhodococcus sp. T2V TaxID=3034164 RepID=UPI0023E17ADB|nr:hypothetical protein [Rhodococcus sp. T2V]MDF3313466.1 hypothetical protein [Rhodococcus sp. T2V]